jgi:glycosyltransferase involved in cell wall biosynthesis
MHSEFEILIPVRNPTEVFRKTIESLVAQTDKRFSVLISDNFSTSGHEHIEHALALLSAVNLRARRVRPPSELGRVEHWNWLHYQSGAEWLKPLFAGDWLEPDYIAAILGTVATEPRCSYFFCGYHYHRGEETRANIPDWGGGRYFTPEEMQNVVLRYAMQFGPPSAAAYRREIFLRSGGYDPRLPICADSLLFCKLAARNGAFGVQRPLVHFLIHAARFSDTLPGKQREAFREELRYFADLGLAAWHERWQFPVLGYLRLFARSIRGRLKK